MRTSRLAAVFVLSVSVSACSSSQASIEIQLPSNPETVNGGTSLNVDLIAIGPAHVRQLANSSARDWLNTNRKLNEGRFVSWNITAGNVTFRRPRQGFLRVDAKGEVATVDRIDPEDDLWEIVAFADYTGDPKQATLSAAELEEQCEWVLEIGPQGLEFIPKP